MEVAGGGGRVAVSVAVSGEAVCMWVCLQQLCGLCVCLGIKKLRVVAVGCGVVAGEGCDVVSGGEEAVKCAGGCLTRAVVSCEATAAVLASGEHSLPALLLAT